MDKRKRPGVRHIDRLMDAVLSITEDENQDAKVILDAAKLGFEIIKKRSVIKKKDNKTKDLEKLLTGGPR